jgi:hypothetical protein
MQKRHLLLLKAVPKTAWTLAELAVAVMRYLGSCKSRLRPLMYTTCVGSRVCDSDFMCTANLLFSEADYSEYAQDLIRGVAW